MVTGVEEKSKRTRVSKKVENSVRKSARTGSV
jgi:hypothetical protein